MRKRIYTVLACVSFIIFMVGIGSMDSPNLGLPVVLTSFGLFGTYIFGRWGYEED